MGRRRTVISLSREDHRAFEQQLKTSKDARLRERLRFILLASSGTHTLEELARITGRARSTLQNWMAKHAAGGVAALLERNTPPGKHSALTKKQVQAEIVQGLKAARWTTAQQLSDWLRVTHGILLKRKSVYYWIAKLKASKE